MPYRLLLADDSLTIQKVVELTFSDPEYELLAVGNGEKALDALAAFQPDIVLADVVMPGPPGYDICEAVRKRPGGTFVPVVLLTGTFEPFDRARADRVGATAVVTKPFDSHALAALVRDLLLKAAGERASAAAEPPAPAPAADLAAADEDTMSLGEVEPPAWSVPRESAAAEDLFAEEPRSPEPQEAPELYATSAIPIAAFMTQPAAPSPAAIAIEPPPAPGAVHMPPPPPPPEPVAYVPPPPPPAAEPMAFDEEPLPPPPPFEPGPAATAATSGWELAEEPPPEARAPLRVEESTQPLPAEPEPLPLEEAPPPPPAVAEVAERTEAIDVHSASTPTQILYPPRESEAEPPAEPRLAFEEEPVAEMAEAAEVADVGEVPAATLPAPALALEISEPEVPPAPETEAPPDDFYEGETVAIEALPAPVAPERELPDLGHEEPVARDIEEDIAAFEDSQTRRPPSEPAELEALAAKASLTELIPAASAGVTQGPLSEADVERIARRVVELIAEKAVRDIAWEIVPEIAERFVRERLAEIERQ